MTRAGESPSPATLAACPLPLAPRAEVTLAHGGGGTLSRQLIETLFLPAFRNAALDARHDGAVLSVGDARIAFSTDTYVVHPLVFPGGDLGHLAVNGTVNDLAMCGARPLWLSAGFVLEEGVPLATLERIVASMRHATRAAGVELVTGDTKVVERGKGDGIFVNTAGIGIVEHAGTIGPRAVRPGDAVIVSGDVGRHGIAILSVRAGIEFEGAVASDCAPIATPALALLDAGIAVRALRDPTRGGLSSALNEIADSARVTVRVNEAAIPLSDGVRGACELLGLDPFAVACEGRFVAFVARGDAERALAVLREHPVARGAAVIGRVEARGVAPVLLESRIGTVRVLDMQSGEQLPRIC